jgi:hypothetical protein
MANTYVKIASVSVGVLGAANMEFTSIPSTYTDLKVLLSHRSSGAYGAQSSYLNMNINGVGTNRSFRVVEGFSGTTAGSNNGTNTRVAYTQGTTSTASTFSSTDIYIPNYAGSSNKSFSVDSVTETNSASADSNLWACLWSQTAAITSLTFTVDSGNFTQYSTATLYGILKN